jgi:hypothetical protein
MNLKKIIREELGSGNPLDWMMGEPKFNPNEILQEQISLKEDKKKDDGFDWVRQTTINVNDFLNKAFYFDPIAEEGDKDYEKLIDYLNQIGFKSEYNTPSSLYGDEQAVGLYAYRGVGGSLEYVYTTHIYEDEDGSYWEHIRDFATRNSEEEGDNLMVVDARDFVNSYLH